MEGKADKQIERHPRQIEQCRGSAAGEKSPDLVEVAKGLLSVSLLGRPERDELALEYLLAQLFVHGRTDPRQDPPADHVEQTLKEIKHDDDDRQSDQRRNAAAGQNPVIDLHHEDRSGEIKDVDQAGQEGHASEGAEAGCHDLRGRTGHRMSPLRELPTGSG